MKAEVRNQKSETRIKLWPMTAVIMAILAIGCLTGCKEFGTDTTAPNVVEQKLFTTVTNYVQVPVQQTNTTYTTNTVTQFATNTVGQIVTVTNEVVQPKYNLVWVTNEVPQYQNTVSSNTASTVSTAGGILNMFFPGIGSAVSSGVLALLAIWAQARSGKRQQTASALAQEVETILEFVKSLPNGANYQLAITQFLQSHQLETGVANQVLSLIENQVSNPEAKAALEQIKNTLTAVKTAAAPASA
jgi:hypothetical protein